MKEKKHLSFPSLIAKFRQIITEQFPDSRSRKSQYPLADVVLSGFACMFFQDASMLQFQKRMEAAYKKSNLSTLFGVELIPEETQLRDLIDKIPSLEFSKVFKELFFRLQRGKHLEQFKFYQGSYLVSIDGTQYFTSKSVSCEHCLKKEHRTGEITHSHQALQAAIAHPELKQVIPLMAEDIRNEDGKTKQDCEINAGKRLLGRLRSEHPQLDTIVLGDALYSKQPMVEEVKNQGMHYIFGVKPDDHKTLYKHLEEGLIQQNSERDGKTYLYRWKLDVPLNAREDAVKVNFFDLHIMVPDENGELQTNFYSSWVTDLPIEENNIKQLVKAARCRWKIENECFNTLKNQGYCLEHNFGHGSEYLSFNFYLLTLLAFFFHQIFELTDPLFQECRKRWSKKLLWEELRSAVGFILFDSWQLLLQFVLCPSNFAEFRVSASGP